MKFGIIIHGPQRIKHTVFGDPLIFPSSPTTTLIFGANIHKLLWMSYDHFGNPLTFSLASTSDQTFYVSSTLVYYRISAKFITFPSASAVVRVYC